VHYDYNCILPLTNPEWEKTHAESKLDYVQFDYQGATAGTGGG
jgi:hypothetical protein